PGSCIGDLRGGILGHTLVRSPRSATVTARGGAKRDAADPRTANHLLELPAQYSAARYATESRGCPAARERAAWRRSDQRGSGGTLISQTCPGINTRDFLQSAVSSDSLRSESESSRTWCCLETVRSATPCRS